MLVLMLQHVSSRVSGFPVASLCRWEKLQNLSCLSCFKVSNQVVAWFCVAGLAPRDSLTCLQKVSKVVLCGKRNTLLLLSEDELHFAWQALHFGDIHCHFACQAQYFKRVALHFFWRIALSGQVATRCKWRGRCGML